MIQFKPYVYKPPLIDKMNIANLIHQGIEILGYSFDLKYNDVIHKLESSKTDYDLSNNKRIIKLDSIELHFNNDALYMVVYVIDEDVSERDVVSILDKNSINWVTDNNYTFGDQKGIRIKNKDEILFIFDTQINRLEKAVFTAI